LLNLDFSEMTSYFQRLKLMMLLKVLMVKIITRGAHGPYLGSRAPMGRIWDLGRQYMAHLGSIGRPWAVFGIWGIGIVIIKDDMSDSDDELLGQMGLSGVSGCSSGLDESLNVDAGEQSSGSVNCSNNCN
jgi:hypothetical protein